MKKILILLACTSMPFIAYLQESPTDSLENTLPGMNPDEYIQRIDSLILLKMFQTKTEFIDTFLYSKWPNPDTIPEYPDMFYEFKLEELNKTSPIDLEYHEDVQKNIYRYTITKREEFQRVKGLSYLYFPIIDEYLQKYQLPLELKYIAVIESSLNPLARSRSGAVGLWQFLLHSGKLFDLEVSSYIDERKDPFKATDAACRYLKYLYTIFNDWQLAIAAYNGGPGEVRNAILKSGGNTDFWEIRSYMRDETSNYVPKFIAAAYVMNYAHEHNLRPEVPMLTYFDIDTVMISHALSFQQISEKINVGIDILQFLNPAYVYNFIPDLPEEQILVLPAAKTTEFIQKENQIYANKIDKDDYMTLYNNAGSTKNKKLIYHTVKKGEFYHKIAIKYNCSLENIKAWNGLTDNSIFPGQKIKIWVDPDFVVKEETSDQGTVSGHTTYVVKKGDTLWAIAEHFECQSIQQIIDLNKLDSQGNINPGQELLIPIK